MSHAPKAPARPDRLGTAALLVLLVLTLAPTLSVDVPAMVDYPNHLARMSILARDGTPSANPFYEVAWRFYPNLAMDLIVPGLARIVGVEGATKAFLTASQLLIVSGAVAIALAAGRRAFLSGLMAVLYLHSWPFAFGFLNFAFALGIALWGVAAWIRLQNTALAPRILVHSLVVAALMVAHLFALGLYGFTIGVIELWRTVQGRRYGWRALALYPLMAAPAVLLVAVLLGTGGSVGASGTSWSPLGKTVVLACINGYDLRVSLLSTFALAILCHQIARRGWLRFEGPGAWLAIGYGALFLAMPLRLFDTAFVEMRVVVAAVLVLPAFLTLAIPCARARILVGAAVGAVALLNVGVVASVQMSYAQEYRRMIASFGLLGPAPRVLVAHGGDGIDPPEDLSEYPIFHAPVMAAHYADAFVPTLFAYPGKQPVAPRAEVARLAPPVSNLVPLETLRRIALGEEPGAPETLAGWLAEFDYLYVVGPLAENPLPDTLMQISEGRRYRAYRIMRNASPKR